jgi:hypothetical protein
MAIARMIGGAQPSVAAFLSFFWRKRNEGKEKRHFWQLLRSQKKLSCVFW